MNIRKKMAKGAFWLFLEKGGQQLSSFVVFAVIARLIGPEEYGLVALCGIFLAIATSLINGLVDAVVSMHIKDDQRLSTLLWIVSLCGTSISIATYYLAQPFAVFMEQPKLLPILQCFSILPILLSLSALPTALITEAMNFRLFAIRTTAANLLGGVTGIIMALKGYGAYALIGQQIVVYIIINLIVWPSCKWQPRMIFDTKGMKEIITLGLGQASSSMIAFAEQQLPRFILGFFLGPIAVGQYAFVQRICGAIQDGLIQPISLLIFPAFSQIKGDIKEQGKILKNLFMLVGSILLPIIVGAIITAPIFIPLIFGEKWTSTVVLLQTILVIVVTQSISSIIKSLMRAHQRIGTFLKSQTTIVLIWLVAATLLASYSLHAVMIGYAITTIIAALVYTRLASKKLGINLWKSYTQLLYPLIAALCMGVTVYSYINSVYRPESNTYLLISSIILGGGVYSSICSLILRDKIKEALCKIKKLHT